MKQVIPNPPNIDPRTFKIGAKAVQNCKITKDRFPNRFLGATSKFLEAKKLEKQMINQYFWGGHEGEDMHQDGPPGGMCGLPGEEYGGV